MPGEDQIRLELTVDKTELERQLNQVFGKVQGPTAGRPPGGPPGGPARAAERLSFLGPEARGELAQLKARKRAQAEVGELEALRAKPPATGLGGALEGLKATSGTGGKGLPVTAGQGMLKVLGPIAALLGISLSLAGILKLSKLAGSMLGALSSVLGAMVDSFLAPFMPLMAKGISWLARKGIPAAIKAGEKTFEILGKVWTVIDGPLIFYLKLQWMKVTAVWEVLKVGVPTLIKVGTDIYGAVKTLIDIFKAVFKTTERVEKHFTRDVPNFWREAVSSDRGKLELGPVGKFLKDLGGKLPGFDTRGTVPGKIGSPQLVMARGGEEFMGVGAGRRSGGGGLTFQPTFNVAITAENSIDATRMILKELEPEILNLVSRQFFEMQSQFARI